MKRRPRRSRRVKAEGPPKILALLAACPLYPEPAEGRCGACGKELRGKRTRWCSKTCSFSWRNNHVWTFARRAARTRDGRKCVKCGKQQPRKPSRRQFKSENAYDVARAAYDAVKLEVNHKVGLAGAKRAAACCSHHLQNLETLCGACHAPITAAQSAERANARRDDKVRSAIAAIGKASPVLTIDDPAIGADQKSVRAHLNVARRSLEPKLKPFFVGAVFDFAAKQLVGRDGFLLQFISDSKASAIVVAHR